MRMTQVSSGLIATQTLTSLRGAVLRLRIERHAQAQRQAAAGGRGRTDDEIAAGEFGLPLPNDIFLMARLPQALLPVVVATGACAPLRGCAGRCRSGRCWSSPRRCPCRSDAGFFFSSAAAAMIWPGLAVAALRHVDLGPGLLHRVRAVARQAFDGDDLVGGLARLPHRDRAGALHLAVDVHRAGAALRDAAAVFGAGQADLLANGAHSAASIVPRVVALSEPQ